MLMRSRSCVASFCAICLSMPSRCRKAGSDRRAAPIARASGRPRESRCPNRSSRQAVATSRRRVRPACGFARPVRLAVGRRRLACAAHRSLMTKRRRATSARPAFSASCAATHVGFGLGRIEFEQKIARLHMGAGLDVDRRDLAGVQRFDDLRAPRRLDLAQRDGVHVEPSENRPDQGHGAKDADRSIRIATGKAARAAIRGFPEPPAEIPGLGRKRLSSVRRRRCRAGKQAEARLARSFPAPS